MDARGINNLKIRIPYEEVLRLLGRSERTVLDKKTEGLVKEQIDAAYCLIEPRGAWKELRISQIHFDKIIFNELEITSPGLARHLKNSVSAVFMAVSIGDKVTEKTGDTLTDTIRDAVGSAAVEELADEVNRLVTADARRRGFATITRFSPGYGGWALEDQRKVLETIGTDFVKASKSHILLPRKSITAVIGLVKNDGFS